MPEVYMVIELQKNGNSITDISVGYNNRTEAYSRFHTMAAAAAISNVEKHSILLVNDDGFTLERASFTHEGNE